MEKKKKFKPGDLVEFKGLQNLPPLGVYRMGIGAPLPGEIGIITLVPNQEWQTGWVDVVFPSTGQTHVKFEELRLVK